MPKQDIKMHAHQLSTVERTQLFKHCGGVLWLTGLSAAGKSTIAMNLEKRLHSLGYACYTLDGDNLRSGLNADLGFSESDRTENIRRVGEVASLFADAGLICIAAFISPYRADRAAARLAAKSAKFCEIYLDADLEACEARDPKGLYKKARNGLLKNFTGIDAPYELPLTPELVIETHKKSVEKSVEQLLAYVKEQFPLG